MAKKKTKKQIEYAQRRAEQKRNLASIMAGKGGTLTLYPPKPRSR